MKHPFLFLLMALLMQGVSCHAENHMPYLPDDWEFPEVKDISNEKWRQGMPGKALVISGDFDADKLTDYAVLATHKTGESSGLLVYLSRESGNNGWQVLDLFEGSVNAIGIDLYPPGDYRVLCVDESENCGDDGKYEIRIYNDSISYYRVASSGSIFIWNVQNARFDQIWESD